MVGRLPPTSISLFSKNKAVADVSQADFYGIWGNSRNETTTTLHYLRVSFSAEMLSVQGSSYSGPFIRARITCAISALPLPSWKPGFYFWRHYELNPTVTFLGSSLPHKSAERRSNFYASNAAIVYELPLTIFQERRFPETYRHTLSRQAFPYPCPLRHFWTIEMRMLCMYMKEIWRIDNSLESERLNTAIRLGRTTSLQLWTAGWVKLEAVAYMKILIFPS